MQRTRRVMWNWEDKETKNIQIQWNSTEFVHQNN